MSMFDDFDSIEEMLDSVIEDKLTQDEIDSLPLAVRESIIEQFYESNWFKRQFSRVYTIEAEADDQWPYK